MRYVIHIGPRKTGSTYLQETLYGLRRKLAEDGICYPANGFMMFKGATLHTRLFRMIRGEIAPDYQKDFAEIRAGNFQTVVLSDEHFSEFNREHIVKLREAMGPAQVEVIFYGRCLSERLPSNWIELVKSGTSTPFLEWINSIMDKAEADRLINSALTWKKWAEVFGRNAIRIISYDSLREKKVDIAAHFCQAILNWKGDTTTKDISTNVSPKAIPTEVTRALNHMDALRKGRAVPGRRNEFVDAISSMDQGPLEELMGEEVVSLKLSDNAPQFALVHAQMNEWTDRLVPVAGERQMTSMKVKSFSYVRANYLINPKALPLLTKIYEDVPLYNGVRQK